MQAVQNKQQINGNHIYPYIDSYFIPIHLFLFLQDLT